MKYRLLMLMSICFSVIDVCANENVGEKTLQVKNVGCPIWLGIVLCVLCVVLVAAVVLLFSKTFRMEEIVRKQWKTIKDMQNNIECDKRISEEAFKSLRDQGDLMMKLFKSSVPTSNNIKNQDNNFVDEMHVSSQTIVETNSSKRVVNPPSSETFSQPISRETKDIYFGSPQGGVFIGGIETFKPGISMYCVKDKGLNEATFTIVERKEAKTMLKRSITKFLESACDVIGNTNEFSDIVVKQTGIVKKTYDGWKIIKKALVEVI